MTKEPESILLARAFGMMDVEEVKLLKQACKELHPQAVVVNIGAGFGTSALAIREELPKCQLYSVDKSTGGPLGGFENERNAFSKANLPLPVQLLGDSKSIAQVYRKEQQYPKPIDFLFIDGDHSYEGVMSDLSMWTPMLADQSLIAMHDFSTDKNYVWPDVSKAFYDFMFFVHDNGVARIGLYSCVKTLAVFHWSSLVDQ